jgi:hypothetical protein
MANQIEILVKANADGAKKAFGSLTEQIAANRKKIGVGLTGIGAGITGLAALSIKAAQEEAIGISKLDQALKNVGTSYDANKTSIEEVISATQRKTNFGDEEQREVLSKLVSVLGDEKKALMALPAVLDASAASGKSAGTVAQTMSKFLAGLANQSDAVGISVDKSADFTERLGRVMETVGGQAEATADPFIQFKNRTGDLSQEFGKVLLPMMTDLAGLLDRLTEKVINFTEKHPELTKWLAIGAAAFGAIALVVGPLLLILPGLAMAFTAVGVAVNLALGPVGLIILTIAAVTAGVILLWKNWDTVWGKIKSVTETVVNFVIELMNKMTVIFRKQIDFILDMVSNLVNLGSKIPGVGDKFKEAARAIEEFSDKLDEGIPKIDITAEKQVELADKTGELGEAFHEADKTIETANQGIVDSTEQMAVVVNTAAEDMANAWGEVEDVMMGVAIKHKEALDAQTTEQARFDALVKLSSESRSSQFKKEQEDFMARMRHQGNVYDGMLDSTEQYYEHVAKAAEESASRVEVAANRRGTAENPHIGKGMRATAQAAYAGGEVLPVGSSFDASGWNKFSEEQRATARMDWSGMSDKQLKSIGQSTTQEAVRWAASQERFKRATATSSFRPGNMLTSESSTWDAFEAAKMAQGGIVTRPTMALIGEAGPEAVIPLGRGGGMGSLSVTVNIGEGAVVGVDDLQDTIAQTVRDVAERGGFRGVF